MMKQPMRKLRSTLAILLLSGAAAPAFAGGAGGIVFDPSNFAQNIQQVVHAVAQEQLAIQAAVRQVQMLANSVKNATNTVKSVTGIRSITDAEQTISSLMAPWDVDASIIQQLGGQSNFVQGVMAQFAANPTVGSFTNYVQNLANQSAAGQQNATSLIANYTNMSKELQRTMQKRQAIASQNTGSLGTNDSIAITNASLDNLAEINQATLQGIQTLVRQAAYKESVEAANSQSSMQLHNTASDMAQKAANSVSGVPGATKILGY